MLLEFDERRFIGYRRGASVQVLGRVRCVRHGVHAGVRCARGALVAPRRQIRKVQRVGA